MLGVEGVQEDARIVVLDLGGGTADVAIVDRAGRDLAVVGRPIGIEGAGGEDFDFRLAEWMTEEVGVSGLYRRLAESTDPAHREQAVLIRRLARSIKEELSRRPVVPAQLPRSPPDLNDDRRVQVTRPQLEDLIRGGPGGRRPGLTEAVELVNQVQEGAPAGPPFAGVYLVGGSSRIPLLGELIQSQTQRGPIIGGDPSTAVADGAAEYARTHVNPRHAPPPPPVKPKPPPVEPKPTPNGSPVPVRTVLGALIALVLMVGGVLIIGKITDTPSQVPPPVSTPGPGATAAPPPSTPPTVGSALLATCPSPTEGDCRTDIIAASRAAWPTMPDAGCDVHGPLYSSDRYSAECYTSDTSYLVFWRDSGSVVSMVAGQMLMPTLRDFILPGTSVKLGSQAFGTRSTPSGDRYTCVWEYAEFPVTMVIDGPNDNGTLSLCGNATFLDEAALRSAVRPG
jgi:hypothetical protein